MYLLYWTVQFVAFPVLLLYLLLRVARNRSYLAGLPERFGFLPRSFRQTVPDAVWLHAVSVGEIIAAVPLLLQMRQALPGVPVFVSTSTLAGRAMAARKIAGLAAGVFYSPLDYRFAVRRDLRLLKPRVVVVMETEIWPNLYRETKRSGARLLVVNGRISDKALPSYLRWRAFFRSVLAWPDEILAQDETAASRYRLLGAARVRAAGNLKYDFSPEAAVTVPPVSELVRRLRPESVWIAASTMPPAAPTDPDEDDVVLDTFERLRPAQPGLLLILVPRRPERFDQAAARLAARNIPYVRRSALGPDSSVALPGVLLLDSIGELSGLFRLASAVFMGGTLVERGGHNILEPAAFGVPIVTGPHMENFTEIAAEFRAAGAVRTVASPGELPGALDELLRGGDDVRRLSARGRELAEGRRGATARAVERIAEAHDAALVALPAWNPLGVAWRAGMALDRLLRRRSAAAALPPVVSVGNLAAGGTGKTPFVLWLAEELADRGWQPGVLTRGYRRQEAGKVEVLLPGESAPVARTGEEAQLILQSGHAAVAIGADRRAARAALLERYKAGVLLLDDGFQHWPLQRDIDIVLIDAVDPLRGGLLPRGRLREPLSALARTDVIVITRARPGRGCRGLVDEVRRHNASAPVFFARDVLQLPDMPPGAKVGAFCGLGQPEGFRRGLESLGLELHFFEAFPDHHHYTADEIRSLLGRADVLLTTQKDWLNLPDGSAAGGVIHPVPLRLEIDRPRELLRELEARLPARAARA
jgi:tetraacyldisaccharide 4'-kinase